MEYRLLGRTGVSVSPLCLGTMMFGPWGNNDRADATRVIYRALDAGITRHESAGQPEPFAASFTQNRRVMR
jgi:aryl-alcohol dehydrogenase-like predicted oxidoreductase